MYIFLRLLVYFIKIKNHLMFSFDIAIYIKHPRIIGVATLITINKGNLRKNKLLIKIILLKERVFANLFKNFGP